MDENEQEMTLFLQMNETPLITGFQTFQSREKKALHEVWVSRVCVIPSNGILIKTTYSHTVRIPNTTPLPERLGLIQC